MNAPARFLAGVVAVVALVVIAIAATVECLFRGKAALRDLED